MSELVVKLKSLPKNCLTCANVSYESCDCSDYGCSHERYFYCEKNEDIEKMNNNKYLLKSKKCWDKPIHISFTYPTCFKLEIEK